MNNQRNRREKRVPSSPAISLNLVRKAENTANLLGPLGLHKQRLQKTAWEPEPDIYFRASSRYYLQGTCIQPLVLNQNLMSFVQIASRIVTRHVFCSLSDHIDVETLRPDCVCVCVCVCELITFVGLHNP